MRKVELYAPTHGVLADPMSYVATVEIAPFPDSGMPDIVFWGSRVFRSIGGPRQHQGVVYHDRPWAYLECSSYASSTSIGEFQAWEPPLPKPVPPVDESARDVVGKSIAPGEPDTTLQSDGQQAGYVVLNAHERAKGFVRPVRRTYVHVGRKICGKHDPDYPERAGSETPIQEYAAFICVGVHGHEGDCVGYRGVSREELERFKATGMLGGCDTSTSMGLALAETYARKPDFYGATYCAKCQMHLPVGKHGEFVWQDTNEKVGT